MYSALNIIEPKKIPVMKNKLPNTVCLAVIIYAVIISDAYSQLKFYESSFNGGVTGTGYAPDHSGSGSINLVINIAPGSTIHQAYIFAGRHGAAAPLNFTFAGQSLLFDIPNQVSTSFNSIYGGASGVHAIDVTALVNPSVNNYTLIIPTQSATINRYQEFYLYVAYQNTSLPLVNSVIFVNTVNFGPSMSYPGMTVINPISNSINVGLSVMTGYCCFVPGDGEDIFFNGNNLGVVGGADIGSGYCGGPMGSFYYQNNTLSGLSDDFPDFAMDSADVLSNIQSIVVNNTTNFSMQFNHHNGVSDNSIWAVFLTYGQSCAMPVANAGTDTTICNGDSVTLSGSGGGFYQWSGGISSSSQTVTVSPSITTNYLLVVTDSTGCQSLADTVTVFVNQYPVISFSGNISICIGDSTTLTAIGGSSFQWSGGGINATTATITVAPTSTTTYFVTVSNGNCSSMDSVTVIVNSVPVVSITGNTIICAGDSTILTASGGSSFQWSGGGINATTASVTVSPASTTTYFVTVSNGSCSATGSVTVTVNPVPVVSITGNTIICAGDSTTLTATGGNSYQWSGGGINATTASVTVSPISTTTYSVTVSNGSCSATGSVTVTVNSVPVVSITGNTIICAGDSTTLTATGGNSYQWSGGGINATTATITVSPTSTTTYSVTVSDGNCSATGSVTVTVNSVPVVSITGNTIICAGDSTTLTASGGNSFQWSGGGINNTTFSVTVSPTATTTYFVTVSNGSCSATGSVTVTVNSVPVVSTSGNTTICAGDSTSLTASGGNIFQWSGGGINATTASVTVSPTSTTTYFVTVSNGSCSATGSVTVTVNSVPVVSISGNTTICAGDSTTLTASGGNSFQWSGGGINATTASITVSPSSSTIYTVSVSNGFCNSTVSVLVTVNQLPLAQISGNDSICSGESTTLTGSGGTSFQWSGNITSTLQSITVSPLQNSTYVLVVGDGNCFSNPVSINVTVFQSPAALFTYEFDECTGVLSVASQSSNASTINWNFGDGTSTSSVQNTVHTYLNAGNYIITLTVISSDNCTDSVSVQVYFEGATTETLNIPNIITPNGDDKNENLIIKGLSNCSSYNLKIFSRWGIRVFESDVSANNPWNGRYTDGNLVDDGVYFYILTSEDKLIKKGFITVIK